MVGPISSQERSAFARRLKVGLSLVVGISAGLMALNGDAALPLVLVAVAVGLLVGVAAVWFVFPGTGEVQSDRDDRRRFE